MKQAKGIVVVIDMQHDFISGALSTPEAKTIVPAVVARMQAEQEAGSLLVFTRDTHGPDYLTTLEGKLLPAPHCEKGTEGWELAREIAPFAQNAILVDKPTFGSVALPALLRPHVGPDTEFLIFGLCTDVCVASNALLLRAHFPNHRIFVAPDCCAGITPQSHEAALTTMAMCQIQQA